MRPHQPRGKGGTAAAPHTRPRRSRGKGGRVVAGNLVVVVPAAAKSTFVVGGGVAPFGEWVVPPSRELDLGAGAQKASSALPTWQVFKTVF